MSRNPDGRVERRYTDEQIRHMQVLREQKVPWTEVASLFDGTVEGLKMQVKRWGRPVRVKRPEGAPPPKRIRHPRASRYPTQHIAQVGEPMDTTSVDTFRAGAAENGSRSLLVATLRYGAKSEHNGHLTISPAQCVARLKMMGVAA